MNQPAILALRPARYWTSRNDKTMRKRRMPKIVRRAENDAVARAVRHFGFHSIIIFARPETSQCHFVAKAHGKCGPSGATIGLGKAISRQTFDGHKRKHAGAGIAPRLINPHFATPRRGAAPVDLHRKAIAVRL